MRLIHQVDFLVTGSKKVAKSGVILEGFANKLFGTIEFCLGFQKSSVFAHKVENSIVLGFLDLTRSLIQGYY